MGVDPPSVDDYQDFVNSTDGTEMDLDEDGWEDEDSEPGYGSDTVDDAQVRAIR